MTIKMVKIYMMLALILCLLFFSFASQASTSETIILGVTEPSYDSRTIGKIKTSFFIRVAFICKDGIWKIFPNEANNETGLTNLVKYYPSQVDWNLTFDGKKIGECTSQSPKKWSFYGDVGLELPDKQARLPSIQIDTENFHYWGEAWIYPPKNRPLIATSGPYIDDPDKWKPVKQLPTPTQNLILAYRQTTKKSTENFSDKQISVMQCYRSNTGEELISLSVPRIPDEEEVEYLQWFHINNDQIKSLGSCLDLIDAADYDHDGHSEVVFHKYGYNYDAYVLLYNNSKNQLEFGWSYH